METFLHAGFSNAVAATLLAVVAVVVSRLWRNQFAANLLWLIVLLKLVTPPLIEVPIPYIDRLVAFDQQRNVDVLSRVRNQQRRIRPDLNSPSNVSVSETVVSNQEIHSPELEISTPHLRAGSVCRI